VNCAAQAALARRGSRPDAAPQTPPRGRSEFSLGNVIKKRRKKMRKHKKRKLLRRARHKRKK